MLWIKHDCLIALFPQIGLHKVCFPLLGRTNECRDSPHGVFDALIQNPCEPLCRGHSLSLLLVHSWLLLTLSHFLPSLYVSHTSGSNTVSRVPLICTSYPCDHTVSSGFPLTEFDIRLNSIPD